tara:strand:- start:581 stop:1300 length:720 start_codon:yes stop_codon:yes gene_type:complete
MYLLIDIGNTRIKWQHRDQKNILLSNDILVENFMDIDFSQIESLKKILVSNVNHKIVLEKVKKSLTRFNCPLIEVDAQSSDIMINNYEDISQLGVDRWLTALGAWRRYEESLLVINAGTAITIDLIELDKNKKLYFRGGMILPGIAISLAMLNSSTNLIDTELGKNSFPSLNTTDAVTTGIFTSIQGAVNLVRKQFSSSLPILLTGGDAHLIYEQADEDWKSRTKLEDDLLFDGLEMYI